REWKNRKKTVFITGGARGIGLETARQLVAGGHNVALVDVLSDEVEAAAAGLGDRAIGLTADVREVEDLRRAAADTAHHFGGIDVSIPNAGLGLLGPFLGGDRAQQQLMIDVNLGGVIDTLRVTAPYVIERRGYLLPIASAAALVHVPLHAVYAATKAGVEALANAMRCEMGDRGVSIGVGYFLYIQTPMVEQALGSEIGSEYEKRLLPPLNKRLPVDQAGAVMVRGIERRSRRVYAPRILGAMLPFRQFLSPVIETQMRLTGTTREVQKVDAPAERPRSEERRTNGVAR
ncbi:SDR family NAD(P)-dependent oxidoreductase, partial [Paraconexibacter sp.]|uniref:SDR family NAD(P)-dependent oxidoreductase n=1 Tax=Paraconexibacter sp. TaxID=2949640 RepID=UPI003565C607